MGFQLGRPPMTLADKAAESDPPVSLDKKRVSKELAYYQRVLTAEQSVLTEMGEARAVECVQEAIEGLEAARQFLVGGR